VTVELPSECFVAHRARRDSEAPAVITPDGGVDFAAYDAAIERAVDGLAVAPGGRVALCEPPSLRPLCLLHALWRQGSLAVPVSTRLPASERDRVVGELGATLMSTGPVEQACRPEAAADLDLPAVAVLTSGSSGRARAVVHSREALGYNALGANCNMPLQPGDRWLLSLPLFHVSGLGIVMRTALAGAAIVIDDARRLPGAIRAHDVTHVSVVPFQLRELVSAWRDEGALTSLKGVLVGGAAVPGALIREAHDLGIPLYLSYGSTEMGSQVTTTAVGEAGLPAAGSGRLLPFREMIIAADGEILVRGPSLCLGVLGSDGVRDCRDADGWYHTGDYGHLAADGALHVEGRGDRMFISGGENIYPEEIEAALLDLPSVEQAFAMGVPDATYGARPVAVVKGVQPGACDEDALRAQLGCRLPDFKIPDRFLSWPANCPVDGLKQDRPFLQRYVAACLGIEG